MGSRVITTALVTVGVAVTRTLVTGNRTRTATRITITSAFRPITLGPGHLTRTATLITGVCTTTLTLRAVILTLVVTSTTVPTIELDLHPKLERRTNHKGTKCRIAN